MIAWKHKKAEEQVRPLLNAVQRADPNLMKVFPRPITQILPVLLAVSFESHRGLRLSVVVELLHDVYGVDHREALDSGDDALAGYLFVRGDNAVIFSDPQHGEGFELFTQAHEAGHLVVEYLPKRARAGQGELFAPAPAQDFWANRDSFGHLFAGGAVPSVGLPSGMSLHEQQKRLRKDHQMWLREVVANAWAAEFLAPYREVLNLVGTVEREADRVSVLRTRFGLSKTAATVRLADLGLIPDPGATFLFER